MNKDALSKCEIHGVQFILVDRPGQYIQDEDPRVREYFAKPKKQIVCPTPGCDQPTDGGSVIDS